MGKKKNSTIDWDQFWSNVEGVEVEKENFKKTRHSYDSVFEMQEELAKKSSVKKNRVHFIRTEEELRSLNRMIENAGRNLYFRFLCEERLALPETSEYMKKVLTFVLLRVSEWEGKPKKLT